MPPELHERYAHRNLPCRMAGQCCFCGDFGRGAYADVGEDAGGALPGRPVRRRLPRSRIVRSWRALKRIQYRNRLAVLRVGPSRNNIPSDHTR